MAVERDTSVNLMSGVDVVGHRKRADNRLSSTTVPGRLGTGTPGQQS